MTNISLTSAETYGCSWEARKSVVAPVPEDARLEMCKLHILHVLHILIDCIYCIFTPYMQYCKDILMRCLRARRRFCLFSSIFHASSLLSNIKTSRWNVWNGDCIKNLHLRQPLRSALRRSSPSPDTQRWSWRRRWWRRRWWRRRWWYMMMINKDDDTLKR